MDESVLEQPQFRTLRDQVAQTLREAIISGKFKPGERLLEVELAARLGLSRSPLREALRDLEKDGLVQSTPNKGCAVVQFTHEDVLQIFGIRGALERLAVEWAVRRVTPTDLSKLQEVLDRMEAARNLPPAERSEALLALDMEFHRIIYQAAGAERLTRMLEGLHTHVRMLMGMSGRTATDVGVESLVQEHRALLESISAGREEEAVALIAAHVRAAQERILRRFGGAGASPNLRK